MHTNFLRLRAVTIGVALLLSGAALAADAPVEAVVRSLNLAPEATITQGFQSVLTPARSALANSLTVVSSGLATVQDSIITCETALKQKSPETPSDDAVVAYQTCLAPQAKAAADLSRQQAAALTTFANALKQAKTLVQTDQTRLVALQRTIADEQDAASREVGPIKAKLQDLQKKFSAATGNLSFEDSQILARVVDDYQRVARKVQRRADEIAADARKAQALDGAIGAFNNVDVLLGTKIHIASNAADEYDDIGTSIARGAASFGSAASLDLGDVVGILNSLGAGNAPMPEAFPQAADAATAAPSLVDSLPVSGLSAEAARALIDKALASSTGEAK